MFVPSKDKPFYYSLTLLRYVHSYPSPGNLKNLRLYRCVSALTRIVASFVWIECVLHFVMSLKDNVPVDLSEDLVGITGLGYTLMVCTMYDINMKKWSRLYCDVADTARFGRPPELSGMVKKFRSISIFIFIYCFVGLNIYALASVFLESENCRNQNLEKGIEEICGTVTPLWWPHSNLQPALKSIINLYQAFCIFMNLPVAALMLLTCWECAIVITSKIHHLEGLFEDVFSVRDLKMKRRRFRFCVRYHQHIIRMTEELNRLHGMHFGPVSVVSPFVLSCIGFQMIQRYSLGALIHFIGYLTAIFLVCEIGQTVQEGTYNLQDSVYLSKWYTTEPELARDVGFVLLRCQKPVCMLATPIGVFNYSLLIVIIKTAYSYLTLMYNSSE